MKKSRALLVGTIAMVAIACVAFAVPPMPPAPGFPMAGPPMMGPPPHGFFMDGPDEGPLGMLKEELGITDKQKKEMRLLYAAFLDRTRKARMTLMGLKDEHRALMLTGTADLKKLAQLDEQEVKLVSEIMTERFKMRRDRLSILTPDQVEKLASIMAERRFPHPKHGGHGPEPTDVPAKPAR